MLRQAVFDRIRLSNLEQNLGLYGIHLYCNGEEAAFQFRSDDRVNLHSASKTFLSVAVGSAWMKGGWPFQTEPYPIFRNLQKTLPPAVRRLRFGISCTCPPERKIFGFRTAGAKLGLGQAVLGGPNEKQAWDSFLLFQCVHLYFRTGGGKGYREKRQGFSCAAAV